MPAPVSPDDAAVVRNTRYVGALSRNEDRAPVIQKNCHGCVTPSSLPLALSIARAGIMVRNIPMNSFATSAIGTNVKLLYSLVSFFVVFIDRNAAMRMMIISTTLVQGIVTPAIVNPLPSAKKLPMLGRIPLRITAPTIIATKIRL